MINFDLLWTWKQLKISFLVVLLYMWAWIGEFLLLYLIWYYICYEFTPYMALRIWHFCRWKTKVYYFCRKIIRYGISVAKISTYALPGQTLEEITNIFHQFNAWKLLRYYRDILHHFELSWNYRDNRKKHYRSGVVPIEVEDSVWVLVFSILSIPFSNVQLATDPSQSHI